MKRIVFLSLIFATMAVSAQRPVLMNEDFAQKMIDLKEAWTDFDMPTKINGKEARFIAYQCKYLSNTSPAKPCDCSKGIIIIEMSKSDVVPYLEFPEYPSCGALKIGVQSNSRESNRFIALQKLVNAAWVLVDEIELEPLPKGKCKIWEPKNTASETPVKYRLVANKSGSVLVTDIYAEAF